MTAPSIKTDIAIIGAGPTGLMLANLLGVHGIKTTVLERRDAPFTEPRAIAFDPETLRLFQTIGCYEYLAETLQLDVPVHYLNANGKTLAHIYDCPPSFGHSGRGTYYQPELEHALLKGLETRGDVTLMRGVEVARVLDKQDHVRLETQTKSGQAASVLAQYAVDCSGGASQIRKQAGIGFAGTTYREKWLVIDVEGDDYLGCEIKFFCDPKRPAVTLPVSKNRRRWEFLVMPGDNETELASEKSAARSNGDLRRWESGQDRTQSSLYIPCQVCRSISKRTRAARGRCCSRYAAICWPGSEQWYARCRQSGLETGGRPVSQIQ